MPTDNLDPLRPIEGFPLGEDDDLHALSDPPHYGTKSQDSCSSQFRRLTFLNEN
jgi:hypothetical protein